MRDILKAPVKAGKELVVQVHYMVKSSDLPWLRVMRRPAVRLAAKRSQGCMQAWPLSSEITHPGADLVEWWGRQYRVPR